MANKWSAISWIYIEICIYIDTNKYNLIQMLKIIMQMHVVINEGYPFEKASIHKHYYLLFHVVCSHHLSLYNILIKRKNELRNGFLC
jgi:hypothetical protein